MKLLQLIFSILLVCSLALPLSTCSRPTDPNTNIKPERDNMYLISRENSLSDWLSAASFLLPFFFAAATYRRSIGSILELVGIVSVGPSCYLIWLYGFTGRLASGGILAITSITGFVVMTMILIMKSVKVRFQSKSS